MTRLDDANPIERAGTRGLVQLASASESVAGSDALGSAQQAVFDETNERIAGSPSQVIPAQHTTTPKYAPIGRSPSHSFRDCQVTAVAKAAVQPVGGNNSQAFKWCQVNKSQTPKTRMTASKFNPLQGRRSRN